MKNIVMLLLLGGMAIFARAEVVNSLYEARVPVQQRGDAALRGAAAEGLREVLVRVSGRMDVASFSALQRAIGDAQAMVRQYRYSSEFIDGREQLFIDLSFSEQEVNRLLIQSGLPVWDKNRPQTLVWLVVDDVSGRQFVSEASHPEIVAELRRQAQRRGLPLVFPVLDIDDKLQLTTGQAWAMNLGAVRKAAERYRTSQILTGRLTRLSSSWIANFVVVSAQDEDFVDQQAPDLAQALGPIVNTMADELASQFAVVRSGGQSLRENIVVTGVDNFRDYARLLTYLESVALIEHANPVWVANRQMVVQLHLQGEMAKVKQFFLLDKKLEEDDKPGVAFAESKLPIEQLHSYYRWRNQP